MGLIAVYENKNLQYAIIRRECQRLNSLVSALPEGHDLLLLTPWLTKDDNDTEFQTALPKSRETHPQVHSSYQSNRYRVITRHRHRKRLFASACSSVASTTVQVSL